MIHFLTKTLDAIGNTYLVIKFNSNEVSQYLKDLKKYINNDEKFNQLVSNQQARDSREGESHSNHLTVINVMEINKLVKTMGQKEFDKKFSMMCTPIRDLNMIGVGAAIDDKNGNQTFFVVCESESLNKFRAAFGLKQRDLHITIGFDKKDVFTKSKGRDSLINEK